MTWLWVILIVAAIGGIIGYLFSKKGERGAGAAAGAITAGMGCGSIVLWVFLMLLGLFLLFEFGSWLFG
jgi:hypothetical protein